MQISIPLPVVVAVRSPAHGRGLVRVAAREAGLRGVPLNVVHVFAWPPFPPPTSRGGGLALGCVPYDTGRPPRQRHGGESHGGERHGGADRGADHGGADYAASRRTARHQIRNAAEEAARAVPGLVASGEVLDGATLPTLLGLSRRARLVVLGAERLSRSVSLPTDSLPVQMAARAAAPVLIVCGPDRADGPVMVGVDHSPATVPAVELAVEEAAMRGCPLVVLSATEGGPDPAPAGYPAGDGPGPGWDVATAIATSLARYPDVPVIHRRVDLPPAPALIAESHRAQLMVVGVRGWRGTLLGPVTQALLHHAGCPVIVTRSPASGRGTAAAYPVAVAGR